MCRGVRVFVFMREYVCVVVCACVYLYVCVRVRVCYVFLRSRDVARRSVYG